MGLRMGKVSMDRTETTSVEAILKDELARGNRALRGVAPVISHMLEISGPALVSDAIVARLRGMLADLSRQLLEASQDEPHHLIEIEAARIDTLSEQITEDNAIVSHLYALAMEGYLTQRLEQRASLDPVLSPLLQELIASDRPSTAELAMNVMAAQLRFTQSQRRMELPISELPSDLLAAVLSKFEASQSAAGSKVAAGGLASLRQQYDEGAGRIGLLARLVSSLGAGSVAALDLEHSGLALFVSSLAARSRQSRDLAVFACHEGQAARLATSLRAAGLDAEAIESQFRLLGPLDALPNGLGGMPPERAQALLTAGEFDDLHFGSLQ